MYDAYGSSFGEADNCGYSISKSRGYASSTGRSESKSSGTPVGDSISFWASSGNDSARPSSNRVSAAALPLERRLRVLSQQLTVAEFHALRTRLEDYCDEILLNHLP
jgi:hypothetical protein